MPLALVLEDDTFSAMALNVLLEDEGYTVQCFADADLAVAKLQEFVPDVIIADWQIDGQTTSADVARMVREKNPAVQVVFVTGYSADDIKPHLTGLDPCTVFSKPLDYDEFLAKLKERDGAA